MLEVGVEVWGGVGEGTGFVVGARDGFCGFEVQYDFLRGILETCWGRIKSLEIPFGGSNRVSIPQPSQR